MDNARTIHLDGRAMTSREAAHQELYERLALPAYYGRNLDALHDVLTEISERTDVHLTHAGALRRALGAYGDVLLRVLLASVEENPFLHVCVEE